MRKFVTAAAIALVMGLIWFGLWSWMMADDVAQVKATIAHHYKQLREHNQKTSIEADAVYATGFPFSFKVGVKRATISMVDMNETFAISIPLLTMKRLDDTTFRLELPRTFEALYAKNGQAPENYVITADDLPAVKLKADAADGALVAYAAQYPKTITLEMQLGAQKQQAQFMMPVWANLVREYEAVPNDLSRPLQLFVGILREALIYQPKK